MNKLLLSLKNKLVSVPDDKRKFIKERLDWILKKFAVFVICYGLFLSIISNVFLGTSLDLNHVIAFGLGYFFLKEETVDWVKGMRRKNKGVY